MEILAAFLLLMVGAAFAPPPPPASPSAPPSPAFPFADADLDSGELGSSSSSSVPPTGLAVSPATPTPGPLTQPIPSTGTVVKPAASGTGSLGQSLFAAGGPQPIFGNGGIPGGPASGFASGIPSAAFGTGLSGTGILPSGGGLDSCPFAQLFRNGFGNAQQYWANLRNRAQNFWNSLGFGVLPNGGGSFGAGAAPGPISQGLFDPSNNPNPFNNQRQRGSFLP